MQERELEFGGLGFALIAVGFSPPAALADLARHLGWKGSFCSDEGRVLYERLGLGRAEVRQVFNPKTLALYAAAAKRGEAIDRPVEDIRQLGGDALAVAGVAQINFRPASPDDRPAVDELIAAARSLV